MVPLVKRRKKEYNAFMKLPIVREYKVKSEKIKEYTSVLVLSDLHATEYGDELLRMAKELSPDFVLFAGDMGDRGEAVSIAKRIYASFGRSFPCYAVMGNHEFSGGVVGESEHFCMDHGVRVLHGDGKIEHGILVCGLDDEYVGKITWEHQKEMLSRYRKDRFSLLVSHRPDYHKYYRESGFDLVVCGHAHGGQIRIGKINGLYAPGQGLFPKYAGGMYSLGKTKMIVGRGLVQNCLPRWGNPPELVLIHLEKEDGTMGRTGR